MSILLWKGSDWLACPWVIFLCDTLRAVRIDWRPSAWVWDLAGSRMPLEFLWLTPCRWDLHQCHLLIKKIFMEINGKVNTQTEEIVYTFFKLLLSNWEPEDRSSFSLAFKPVLWYNFLTSRTAFSCITFSFFQVTFELFERANNIEQE